VKKDLLFLVTSCPPAAMHLRNQYHRSSSAKRSIKAEGAWHHWIKCWKTTYENRIPRW